MFKDYDLQDLMKEAENVDVKSVDNTLNNGSLSMSIVNANSGGKHITLSKGIRTTLGISDYASLMPIASKDVLMVAKNLPFKGRSVCKQSKKMNGIFYNSELVQIITEVFNLNFAEHVSMSFDEIRIEDLPDKSGKMAIVHVFNKYPMAEADGVVQ